MIRAKDLLEAKTWAPAMASGKKWLKRGLITIVVIAVIWGVLKVVPIDILRGDSGYLLIEGFGEPPINSWRLQVKGDDLRIYEYRLHSNPKFLCVSTHGEFGAHGHCVYDPDYVAPIDPVEEFDRIHGAPKETETFNPNSTVE